MALKSDTHAHLSAHHRHFDEFAERMVQTHAGRFDSVFWSFLKQYSGSPKEIVDFGTGPGLLLQDLARIYPEARINGVEAQPSMLKKAEEIVKANPKQLRLLRHDLARPGIEELKNGSVDLAITSMVLHEMQVPTVLMDEASRVLRSGATWIVYDWVRQPVWAYFENERPATLDEFNHFSEHCRYTPEDWAWLLEKSGFEILEWMGRNDGHHALFAARKK